MRKRIGLLVVLIALLGLMLTGCGLKNHKHEYGEWQVVKKATCTKDGKQERVCSCGKKETEVIKATGHKIVVDEAVEATCTKDGNTEGSHCSVCKKVFEEQEVIPAAHKEEVLPAVAVTCTRAGKGEGVRCTVCGEVLKRQKKIRAPGHNYENGKCTICGKLQPDTAAAIIIDQLNEDNQANFITKNAYPGGSTISFAAFVPRGVGWWAVSWTTNPNNIGLYNWADGAGKNMEVEGGAWKQCSVTLPNDGNNYYIYIVGAKGEWRNEALLIDDVVITNSSGEVLGEDNFNDGLDGLFSVVKTNPTNSQAVVYEKVVCEEHHAVVDAKVEPTCTTAGKTEGSHCSSCGKVFQAQSEIPATGHKWADGKCSVCGKIRENLVAAIVVDKLNESAPMNFITKKAYPGGSTVSFKAYVPKGVSSWWAVSWTSNPLNADLYQWASGAGQRMNSVPGKWTEYSVTLPNDGKNYYIYFVGAKGEWGGKELLLDAFTVKTASGKVIAEDSFDNGVQNGLFNVIGTNPTEGVTVVYDKTVIDPCKNGHKIVIDAAVEPTCTTPGKTEGSHCSVCGKVIKAQSEIPAKGHKWVNSKCSVCGKVRENLVAAIVIDKLNESAPMNFITKKAYLGGSTVSFKAYVPKGVNGWWAVSWTTDPANADLYQWASGAGQSMTSVPGEWTEYSVTLPNDGKKYYIYFVGEKGQWGGKELLLDAFTVKNTSGKVIAEDSFDDGVQNGLFNVIGTNPTEGVTVVYDRTKEDPCKNGHKIVIDAAVEPTCTTSGKTEGSHCSVCGTVIKEQQEIPARGHQYENGVCTVCGATLLNRAVAINIDQLNETSAMNFITRRAYAGGSTVSLRAYVPEGTAWWAIQWTTNPSDTDLYKWSTEGKGEAQPSSYNQWADYSVTLPDDGNTYYIYIVGAKNEWNGKELLIDDVKITSKLGEVVAEDDFNAGIQSGLFTIIEQNPTSGITVVREEIVGNICTHEHTTIVGGKEPTCTEKGILGATVCEDCGEVLHEATEIEATGHHFENGVCTVCGEEEHPENKVAAIKIDRLNESSPMSFITKAAYAGGSEVSFKAYVPEGAGWWAVSWTTNPADTDLYKWTGGETYGKVMTSTTGAWADYSVTLPDDGKEYYIYIVGAKGEWGGKELLIDDFAIIKGPQSVSDNFQKGLADGLFNTQEEVVTLQTIKEENKAAAINIDRLNESSPMSFITKAAYAGGSTVSFKAYVPEGASWWAACWTTDPTDTDLYKWTGGEAYGKAMTSTTGAWADYSVTLPDDGKEYYIYVVGAKGEWGSKELLIDDFTITKESESISDDFQKGLADGLFNAQEEVVTLQTIKEADKMAAINIDRLNESSPMSFITKAAYAGGSTVSFKACVPEGASWWAVSWTTNPADTDLYKWTGGDAYGKVMTSTTGVWADYSVTLPDDGQEYYVYIVGAKGEWGGKELLIDDFTIAKADSNVSDEFTDGADAGLFAIAGEGVVSVKDK